MMDPVGTNHALADHSGDDAMPLGSGMGFPMMDSGDLDDLLAQEEQGNENTMGLDESDIERLLNPDDINISGLGEFNDLDAMPIKELDGRDSLWGNNPTAPSSSSNNNNHMSANDAVDLEDDFQPLPFQRRPKQRQQQQPSGNGSMQMSGQGFQQQQQYQQQQYQQQFQQQQGMGQANNMSDDFDPLQRMVDQAFHSNGNNSMAQPHNFSGNNGVMPNGMMQQQQQQQMNQSSMPSSLDLEQEKQKLLNRLNELNQKQQMPPGNVASALPTVTSRYGQTTKMSPLSDFLRNKSSAASAVPPVEARGESALTSFLRKKGTPGAPASGAPATMGRSMLSANVPGAPTAASVFSEKPMDIDSLLLRRKPNAAMGRMGGATAAASNPNLVRNLSGRNMRGGIGLASSGSRNAAWGEGNGASSFQTSGILPKHASDNHLVRAGKVGLTRSRSKAGSVSRENLMYMKKSGSRNQLQRDDSMGQLLPIKRRQGLGAKHKLGVSRSVPALLMNNNNGGFSEESTTNGYQGNALWG